jgi:hypothetical protein
MRAALVLVLFLLLVAPAGAAMQSENVRVLGKVPDSAGAIGARFSPDGDTMYVTAATGLQIYDVSAPEAPRKLSQLVLPHLENEDVDVGRDTLVISNDPAFTGVGVLYLIDVSDPRNPSLRSTLPTNVPLAGQDNSENGHIANCIQGCNYLYTTGSSEGLTVYDIRDLDAPRKAAVVELPGGGFTHDVEVDSSGIAWVTGEDGTFGYDTTDPLAPLAGLGVPEGSLQPIARLLVVEQLVGARKAASVDEFVLGPQAAGQRRVRVGWREPRRYSNVEPGHRVVEGSRAWR